MTQPASTPTPSWDQLVSTMAAARRAHQAVLMTRTAAQTAWNTALAAQGLGAHVGSPARGRPALPAQAPATAPSGSGSYDLNALASNLSSAIAAEQTALAAYTAARAAHAAALVAAGAQ